MIFDFLILWNNQFLNLYNQISRIMKKSIMVSLGSLALASFLLMVSCEKTNDTPGDPVPIDLTLKQASLITSTNTFAFDIFREILKSQADENIIISPLSISYALSMTVNGANNVTRDSILKALRVSGISVDDLNKSYSNLTDALLKVDSRVNIKIANSVWTENNFVVKKPFTDVLTDYYDAESQSFDINDVTVPAKINTWIENHTNGLIKNMVDRLNENTVMLLINAIYFKGKWRNEFDVKATTARNFTKTSGSTVSVQTMHQKEKNRAFAGDGFVVAELPYGQGNFVMDIILPDGNNLTPFAQNLTGADFTSWINSLTEREINLYLPRFKNEFKKKLKDVLSSMGMGVAFNDAADFSNISDLPLLINDVTHQALIETNEEGTEAAAATIVDIGFTSAGPNDPITIDVNRPFIYVIRETTTNSILFMGRVTDPSK
jgi:serpin B